uniref:RRM domain-containing protein n=1 Tax=Meloidogyne hapla TaxID=6305 RepID=A0A1I8BIA0_MELHA
MFNSSKRRSRDYSPEDRKRRRDSSTSAESRSHERQFSRSSNYGGRPRHNDGRDNPEPSNCLGIFGMTKNTTEKDLRRIFENFGTVDSVQIVYDKLYGDSRGYGFIYFKRIKDATQAREGLANAKINGVRVRVDYSVTSYAGPNRHFLSNNFSRNGSVHYNGRSRYPLRYYD